MIDIGKYTVPKLPEKPTSPCLVADLSLDEQPQGLAAHQACHVMLMESYCTLVAKGVFYVSYDEGTRSGKSPLHPIQDPTGALFAALMIVHRQRPGADVFADPEAKGRLSKQSRKELSAILVVCQKMAMQGPCVPHYVQHVLQHFLEPFEWPRWELDWQQEYCDFKRMEMQVVRQSLLSLTTTTAMGQVESELERLRRLDKLSLETCILLRGCAFFFLASCLLNGEFCFDDMAASVGERCIGDGCVSLMLTLLHTSGMVPGGRGLQASEVLYRAPYGAQADVAAQAILRAAIGPHAEHLRAGPYEPPLDGKEEQPVWRLVSPENLRKGANVFLECM